MDGTFERVAPRLYQRKYRTSKGELSVLYYARFKCKLKKQRRLFALGTDLGQAKADLTQLRGLDAGRFDFDSDDSRNRWKRRQRGADAGPEVSDGKTKPFTFSEWAALYPSQPSAKMKKNGKPKRSLDMEARLLSLHIVPFFGPMLLTEITREDLKRYTDAKQAATVIRHGRASSVQVKAGTIANHLSLLRRVLKVAAIEGYRVLIPVFDCLINRNENAGRALTVEERQLAIAAMPRWLARAFEFAIETCMDEGDVIRLTESMIDFKAGEVVPEGGRIKTQVIQRAMLTDRAREILAEIKADKKAGRIVPNARGLIFTRDDGTPFDSGNVYNAIQRARKEIGYFRFKDARHTAKTDWMEKGINQDIAMLGAGHKSLAMHQRYQHPRAGTVAAEFRRKARMNSQYGNTDGNTAVDGDERESVNN